MRLCLPACAHFCLCVLLVLSHPPSEVHGSKILMLLSLWHRPWQLETLFSIIKGAVVADQLPFTGRWLSWGHRFAWRISKRLKWPCGKRSTNYIQLHPITANYHPKLAPITILITLLQDAALVAIGYFLRMAGQDLHGSSALCMYDNQRKHVHQTFARGRKHTPTRGGQENLKFFMIMFRMYVLSVLVPHTSRNVLVFFHSLSK